jgi:hypothetical protein
MNQQEFAEFVKAASRRAINKNGQFGQIGQLVLTQKALREEPEIREPEMRHALAQEAESQKLWYGIEVPTKEKYRFVDMPGERKVAARHDFVILEQARPDANRSILLELKRGQPAMEIRDRQWHCPAITKDFQKLLLEQATDGKGILHILHAANAGTLEAVLQKYRAALTRALELPNIQQPSCWFILFILVVYQRGQQRQIAPVLRHLGLDNFGPELQNPQDILAINAFQLLDFAA